MQSLTHVTIVDCLVTANSTTVAVIHYNDHYFLFNSWQREGLSHVRVQANSDARGHKLGLGLQP